MNEARQLLQLTGTELEMRQMLSRLQAVSGLRLPSEYIPRMLEYAELATIHHYTSEEIQGLIEFYSSPVGQALLRKQPAIIRDCMNAGARIAQGLEPEPFPEGGAR